MPSGEAPSSSSSAQLGGTSGAQPANGAPPDGAAGSSGAATTALLNAATGGQVSFMPKQVQALLAVLGGNMLGVTPMRAPAAAVPVNAASFPQFTFTSAQPAPAVRAPVPAGPAPAAQALLTDPPAEWYETNSFVSRQAAFYLWHGLASSTRSTYSTGQWSFLGFVALQPVYRNSDGEVLPASQRAVMDWAASLGVRGLQPKTIKAYLSSLRSLHVDINLPFTACEAPVVQCLIRGIKCYHGERARNPKLPITLNILQKLCATLSESLSAIDHTMKAAMALAFAGFLRCGEFTLGNNAKFDPAINLTRGSVKFVPDIDRADRIILTLPSSKTDPFRKGVSVVIAAAPGTITCPVAALQEIFKGIQPRDANSPLFEGLQTEVALSRDLFITRLKALLAAHGFDSSKYSGHSFRRGAASSAAAAGYADFEIQLLGRWRSDAYKLYIDVPQERVLHLSTRLHWAEAEPHA